jgi:hypothetical protein
LVEDHVRALERLLVSAVATAELAPKVSASHELRWDARPTPLRERFVCDPGGADCEVLVLHLDTRAAIFAAAATRVPTAWRLHRPEVHRLVIDLEFIDALTFEARELLTDKAVLAGDPDAWKIVRAIHAEKAACVRVASESHGDTLLVFREALGRVVLECDAAVYAIDRHAVGRRDAPKTRPLQTWFGHGVLAIPAAIVAHPVAQFLLDHAGLTVHVPAFVPAILVALAAIVHIRRRGGRGVDRDEFELYAGKQAESP